MFLDLCENSNALSTILFVKEVINIISIFVPIILILMMSIQIFKMVLSSDDKALKEGFKSLIIKAIVASCVFFVPTLVNLLLSLVNNSAFNETLCWVNANKSTIENYRLMEKAEKETEEEKKKQEKKEAEEERENIAKVREQIREENAKKAKEEAKRKKQGGNKPGSSSQYNTNTGGMGDCKGSYDGTKYNLTNSEIIQLARMVKGEYGTDIDGMKAVASHMANLYELRKHYGYTNGKNIHKYITTCGWYATDDNIYNSNYDSALAQQAVKDVLVNGNRTLPLYIDEFDMYPGDILGNPSMEDYRSYRPGVTMIRGRWGGEGKYFCTTRSGRSANLYYYTSTAEQYKNVMGY